MSAGWIVASSPRLVYLVQTQRGVYLAQRYHVLLTPTTVYILREVLVLLLDLLEPR
jgi:hypothetical protein